MTFDLSTAKKVETGSAFDLSTAKPVDSVEPNYSEAALSMVNSAVAEPIAGLAGLSASTAMFLPQGSGAEMVKKTRDKLTFDRSEGADQALKNIGEFIGPALEYLRLPASGIIGLGEIATGQGLEQATKSIDTSQNQGIGTVLGDRILEQTGNPELATLARTAPDAALAFIGLGVSKKTLDAIPQSQKKQKIAEKIKSGSSDADTARYRITDPVKPQTDFAGNPVVNFAEKSEVVPVKKPKLEKDAKAIKAINQGFTEGAVANVKSANLPTKKNMRLMVDIMEKAKKNDKYAKNNRPSDILGNSLMSRYKVVRDQNLKAGKRLKAEAEKLKRQPIDVSPAVDSFLDDLDDLGIKVDTNDGFSVSFKGSDIEKVTETEKIISDVVSRMRDTKIPDAYDAHRLKKYIDEQVTYGKNAKGLSGTVERVLKKLRRNVDEALDSTYPEYDAVNTIYSDTRGAIDELQSAMGKLDLEGPLADKATGTKLRTLLSNNQGRVNLDVAVNELDGVASQFRKFSDDIDAQVVFVNALEKRFGPLSETGLQGQIIQGGKQIANAAADPTGKGMGDVVTDIASKGYDKLKGVTDERAYSAIRDLLNR